MSRARRAWTVVAAALVVAAVVALNAAGALRPLEQATVDARFALRGTQPVSGVAVVGIDERTFSAAGARWPMPRRQHARMLDRLRRAGVGQVVYDVQFTEPSGRPGQDLALYDAVARTGGVILATAESTADGRTNVLGGDARLRRAGGAIAGASNFPVHDGGAIRDYEPAVGALPTLAARVAARVGRPVPAARFPGGRAPIDFRGPPGTIPTYSFADVLDGRVPDAALHGRIVVVGATAAALQDVHPTPVSGTGLMSGPEIQANAIWTALHGNPLQPAGGWAGTPLALLLALLAVAGVVRFGPLRGALAGAGIAAALTGAAAVAFTAGVILPVALPLAAIAAATLAAAVTATAAEIAHRRRVVRYNAELERAVAERSAELARAQAEIVERLARAAELRDDDTGQHVDRMSRMCGEIATALGLDDERAALIERAAALHDVGKIGVPDGILHKPGPLTDGELTVMRGHAALGARLLSGGSSPLLSFAELIAGTHHERFDGTGYPRGLAGESIPIEGRIAAVSDVFDALTHARPYKDAWSPADARDEIVRCAGTHFDPAVVTAFLRVYAARFGGQPMSPPAPDRRSSSPAMSS